MSKVSRAQALEYLRRIGAPTEVRNALGTYGEDDPNVGNPRGYNEREVFYAPGGTSGGAQIVTPQIYRNLNSFATYGFITGAAAQTIVPANFKRTLLLVQNQSTADDLYVNFSADAGVGNGVLLAFGEGIIFDTICPNNSISVFFDSATNQPGVIIEGSPQS